MDKEENLEKLLEASKNPEDRFLLTMNGTLITLLQCIPTALPTDLVLILRILRNLCAGVLTNQTSFVNNSGPIMIESVICSPLAVLEIRQVGLQLLGNVALAGDEHRAAIWASLFPVRFLELAGIMDSRICDTLCMVLDTCCSSMGGRGRLAELFVNEKGILIIPEILETALTVGYQEEWLEWLVTKICIEEPYFLQLFIKLAPSTDGSGCAERNYTFFTNAQAFLLGLLSKCLSERPGEINISHDFALSTLNILKEAYNVTDFVSRGTSALPTGCPTTDVLGYILMILRDVCAWEDPYLGTPVDSMISAGLVDLVLSFLKELEPPSIVRRSMENTTGEVTISDVKKVSPYRGFRRDVISVLGNCLYGRKQVQDEIRKWNAIPLLLQQCVTDDDSPFQREWGLFAVRNLLEGNEENQLYVAQLQLQDSFNTPEISELGLKVDVDKSTGRVKLVNIS